MKSKCIFISILWLMILPYFTNANWCIQETTSNTKVTKALTKIVTSRKWFGGVKRRTVSYIITQLVPRVRSHRVCCEGYTLDSVHRICEPNCPVECPQYSGCVKPNTCECHDEYQMKGNRCEPICEPTCAVNGVCLSPFVCQCNSGFEYNETTKSCDLSRKRMSMTLSTLADLTTVQDLQSTSEKPQIFSTISKLPTIELSTAPSTISVPLTSTPETSSKPKATTLDYRERNAHCVNWYNCHNGHCRSELYSCQCNKGFVKADSSCNLRSGFKPGECIEESLCKEKTTEEYSNTSTEPIFSSDESTEETETSASHQETDVPSECPEGFYYQHDNGCLPYCDQNCINGYCVAPGECKCHDGFESDRNSFECIPAENWSEKLERPNNFDFPWIWIVLTVVFVVIFGLFLIKQSRKHNYNVDKVENRHIVKFDNIADL